MASSQSHRQMVAPEISATMPRSTASRATSSALQRLKGTPLLAGSSQAMAFTSTLTEGGKGRGPARAGPIFQSGQTFLVKALAPLADRLGCGVQPLGYLLVGDFLGGQEDDPGAHHLPVRGGVGARSFVEDGTLLFGGLDAERALAGHLFPLFDATVSAENLTAQRRERINEVQSRTTKLTRERNRKRRNVFVPCIGLRG